MPVERHPAGSRRGEPAVTAKPQFHVRLPDVFAGDMPVGNQPGERLRTASPRIPPRGGARSADPITAARAALSEKRFSDGQRHVETMIDKLLAKRRRMHNALWIAALALTCVSMTALTASLLNHRDSQTTDRKAAEVAGDEPTDGERPIAARRPRAAPASAAPREWVNRLPPEGPVESAVYHTVSKPDQGRPAFDGTILDDDDSSPPRDGPNHDDHQPRAD